MTKDYAKKSKASRKKSKKGNAKKLWIVALLILIVAAVSFIYPTKTKPRFFHFTGKFFAKEAKSFPAIPAKKKILPSPEIAKTIAPKFDFYNILPGKKVVPTEARYELEIAHAKTFSAADQLKAELALLGFTASITPIYKQGAQKYYVSIGPYNCKEAATTDQEKLKQNKIRSLLRKLY